MLTDDERRTLEQCARRPKTAQRLALRARIVLACAEGLTNRAVATRVPASTNSICKWRERFRTRRLEGLTDEPRPGAPRKATDDVVVDLITRTLEGPPLHATQWTTRGMAEVAGLSKATISRIWRTFGLQSHRVDTFKLSADPQFVDKVRDIVGLYLNPPITHWCSASTQRARSRRWIALGPCCPCVRASPRSRPTTTFATGRRPCSPRWMSRPARSSASVTAAPASRVSAIPAAPRGATAADRRRAHHHGQLLNP